VVAYLPGRADPTPTVCRLRSERSVRVVALDPVSHAATVPKLLRKAGTQPTELSGQERVVAHNQFLDLLPEVDLVTKQVLDPGRLRFVSDKDGRLMMAVKYAQDRRLGVRLRWSVVVLRRMSAHCMLRRLRCGLCCR
jgi:hypothetical protein